MCVLWTFKLLNLLHERFCLPIQSQRLIFLSGDLSWSVMLLKSLVEKSFSRKYHFDCLTVKHGGGSIF